MTRTSFTENNVSILPESLINKIAAGEVVERPASVVKELLENAIDAGATEVQVNIKNGGKDLISILDNGCGMNESNAQLAVERHATSKIIDEEDLFRIRTLGFRGEALASIAAVSHFEILTCNDESQGATRIFIKGGYLEQVGKIGFPKGTKVTIERLFYNTPARLKFLKTTLKSSEFRIDRFLTFFGKSSKTFQAIIIARIELNPAIQNAISQGNKSKIKPPSKNEIALPIPNEEV